MPDVNATSHIVSLQEALRQLLDLHTELLELLKRKRDVIKINDSRAMTNLCVLEHEKLQKIAQLEKQRLKLVADITLKIDPRAKAPLAMTELADHLGEPVRGQLLVSRQQLLERMKEVQTETNVVRRATEALTKHMHGIIQTLGALSSGVATYGSGGSLPQSNAAVSTFSATA